MTPCCVCKNLKSMNVVIKSSPFKFKETTALNLSGWERNSGKFCQNARICSTPSSTSNRVGNQHQVPDLLGRGERWGHQRQPRDIQRGVRRGCFQRMLWLWLPRVPSSQDAWNPPVCEGAQLWRGSACLLKRHRCKSPTVRSVISVPLLLHFLTGLPQRLLLRLGRWDAAVSLGQDIKPCQSSTDVYY